MENKKSINELKIRLLKEQTKKKAIRREIARLILKSKQGGKNK